MSNISSDCPFCGKDKCGNDHCPYSSEEGECKAAKVSAKKIAEKVNKVSVEEISRGKR